MTKRMFGMAVLLLLLGPVVKMPLCSAKPPQLPLQVQIFCAPAPEQITPQCPGCPVTCPAATVCPLSQPCANQINKNCAGGVCGSCPSSCCPCANPLTGCWQIFTQIFGGAESCPVRECPSEDVPLAIPPQACPVDACPYTGRVPNQSTQRPQPRRALIGTAPVRGLTIDLQGCEAAASACCPLPVGAPAGPNPLADNAANPRQAVEIRGLYETAHRHLRNGELNLAYECFQEIHLLSPNSRYGQRAAAKLTEIEHAHASRKAPQSSRNYLRRNTPAMTGTLAPIEWRPVSTRATAVRAPRMTEQYLQRLRAAQEMFYIAERCRRAGDLDMAFTCYHEVARLCPGSDYARRSRQFTARIAADHPGWGQTVVPVYAEPVLIQWDDFGPSNLWRPVRYPEPIQNQSQPAQRPQPRSDNSQSRLAPQPTSSTSEDYLRARFIELRDEPVRQAQQCEPIPHAANRTNQQGSVDMEPGQFGHVNRFLPDGFVTGLTPAGTFTPDLDVPVTTTATANGLSTAIGAAFGATHVEIEMDNSRPGHLRMLGGIQFGNVGYHFTYENGHYSLTYTAPGQ